MIALKTLVMTYATAAAATLASPPSHNWQPPAE